MSDLAPVQILDLRTTKCPLNFVQTCLALEKLQPGEVLEVWVAADSQSALNIPNSLAQEGHTVLKTQQPEQEPGLLKIWTAKKG